MVPMPCVGDDDVQPAELLDPAVDGGLERVVIADVDLGGDDPSVQRLDQVGRFREVFGGRRRGRRVGEPKLMILPPPSLRITAYAAWLAKIMALMFVSTRKSMSSPVICPGIPGCHSPAACSSTSSPPSVSAAPYHLIDRRESRTSHCTHVTPARSGGGVR